MTYESGKSDRPVSGYAEPISKTKNNNGISLSLQSAIFFVNASVYILQD
jgi:hypothetical protein